MSQRDRRVLARVDDVAGIVLKNLLPVYWKKKKVSRRWGCIIDDPETYENGISSSVSIMTQEPKYGITALRYRLAPNVRPQMITGQCIPRPQSP